MPNPVPGLLQQAFIKEQSTYDTMEAFVTGDAVSPVRGQFQIEPTVNFEKIKEACGTASLQSEIQLDQGGRWSFTGNIKPNTAGTPPDIGVLFLAAMGVETGSVYTLSDTVSTAIQGCLHVDNNYQKTFSGGWVEEMSIECTGNGKPTVSFSGGFARMGWAYADVVGTGGIATGVAACPINDASRGSFGVGSRIQFAGDDNSGVGYAVTAVDNTAGSAEITISPVLAGAGEAAGVAITPLAVAQTVAGTILGATDCSLVIDSVSLGLISFKLSVSTGWGPQDKEATSDRPTAIVRMGERVIEAEWEFYFLDSATGNAPMIGRAFDGATRDVDLRIGADTASKRMKISLPKARIDIASDNMPEAEVLTGSAKLVAHQSAVAADELSITFD